MESWSLSHKNLQIFCADFWPSQEDCQAILDELGVSSSRINLGEPSVMRWLSILRELMRKNDGSMGKLVEVLIKQYPSNQALLAVCTPWIASAPANQSDMAAAAGAAAAAHPPPSVPIPVVVPPDFADDAPLEHARIDTLWEAMIDHERRIVELERLRSDLESVYAELAHFRKKEQERTTGERIEGEIAAANVATLPTTGTFKLDGKSE